MKVKFTKLAALLLAGVALFATGCTDYEVDIQKVDKKVDDLAAGKVATLEGQVAALQSTVATLESAADHKADIDKLNKTITDLETALRTAISLKVDQTQYDAKIAEIEGRIKDIEDADFQKQIDDLTTALNTAVATLNEEKADKEQVAKDIEKAVADLEIVLRGEISLLEGRVQKLEEAMEDLMDPEEGIIAKIKKQIEDLQTTKLDVSTFDQYKSATANTLSLMQDAINKLTYLCSGDYGKNEEGKDQTIKEYIDAADKALSDDFTAKYLAIIAKVFGAEEKMNELEGTLLGRLEACEELLAGDWGGKTVKEYIDAEAKKLQDQIDEINEKLTDHETRIADLEAAMAKVVAGLKFCQKEDGSYDLQGYIDDADAATLQAAKDYADEWAYYIIEWAEKKYSEIYDVLQGLAERIQSIVYVPDYDDLKITTNMAVFYQEGLEGAMVIDQPTDITYKILPAQYAAVIANDYDKYLAFDVKPVNTRDEETEEDLEYGFKILAASYDEDTVDETGLVTLTVLPINIASEQFAATNLPVQTSPVFGWSTVHIKIFGFEFDLPSLGYDEGWVYPIVTPEDLEAYQSRAAFAASLRFKDQDIVVPEWNHEEYNEVASTYNVLYPAITNEFSFGVYEPEKDEDGELTGKIVPISEDETQYLPYSALRENPVGEDPEQEPKGYRVIRDGAIPGVEIDGEAYTLAQAAEAGYVVPDAEIAFDEWDYEQGSATSELNEDNFKTTDKVYAELEMNPKSGAAARKTAVGNIITGNYKMVTKFGDTPFYGQVIITEPQGSVKVSAEIVWNYADDADADHAAFYENAGTYARVNLPVTIDADDVDALEKDLAVTIENFRKATPTSVEITTKDEEGNDVVVTTVNFTAVTIDEDGNLTVDVEGFEWDKVYTIVANYDLPKLAHIKVIGTLTTVDRNRELITITLPAFNFDLNGDDYDPDSDTYTSQPEEGDFLDALYQKFLDNKIVTKADFADAEAFKGEDTGKEGHLTLFTGDDVKNSPYVTFGDVYAFIDQVSSSELKEIWKSGKSQESYVTTYTGQLVKVIWPVSVNLPGYDFLHGSYYTFNTTEGDGSFVQQIALPEAIKDVKSPYEKPVWWTQVNPSYFTGAENEFGEPISFRHALADYDVAYINLAELAFNVVDDKDVALSDEEIIAAKLVVKFDYKDETLGAKEIPAIDQKVHDDGSYKFYKSLWVELDDTPFYTTYYYLTNEHPYIPAVGTLAILSGDTEFELPTRFDTPKASVQHPEWKLDYSNYAMVRWTPFQKPVANGYTIVLDENKVYRVPLFKGMELKDYRPHGVEYYVIKDGDWVVGNVDEFDAEAGTYTTGGNGYAVEVLSKDAYHIKATFTYDDLDIKKNYPNLARCLSVQYFNGQTYVDEDPDGEFIPTIVFDYTSEVTFRGTVKIPVLVELENPWQETLKFEYDITIKGVQ